MSFKQTRPDLTIKRIETDKETRLKNIYLFTASMTHEQELRFNRGLKDLINNIGVVVEAPQDNP